MTDKEGREKHLEILEDILDEYKTRKRDIEILGDEDPYYNRILKDRIDALEYAISSIKTDLKYDLLYEGKDILLTFSEGTLKYSNKDYVVYKKDWLKEHFDDERNIVCGEQESAAENDHEILKAHSDGAREVLDNVREEIEQLEMYGVLFSDKQTAIHIDKAKVLEIIDKYREVE